MELYNSTQEGQAAPVLFELPEDSYLTSSSGVRRFDSCYRERLSWPDPCADAGGC